MTDEFKSEYKRALERIETNPDKIKNGVFYKNKNYKRIYKYVAACLIIFMIITSFELIFDGREGVYITVQAEDGNGIVLSESPVEIDTGFDFLVGCFSEDSFDSVIGYECYELNLKCEGESIKQVEYSIESGNEYQAFFSSIEEWDSEKYNSFHFDPENYSDYFRVTEMESGRYLAYKCLGDSLSVVYDKQDNMGIYLDIPLYAADNGDILSENIVINATISTDRHSDIHKEIHIQVHPQIEAGTLQGCTLTINTN
ncbi:MAG: hypothetical protein K6F37_07080 [Lachnospiraceae bacterium]|nr:hypothetical protein [Lachnospiraceae bacterium]